MPSHQDYLDIISDIRQKAHDLYWSRGEDGQLRNLFPCELTFLDTHRGINERYDRYLASAENVHGRGEFYACVHEAATRTRAHELKAAWETLQDRREEAGA